MALHRLKKGLDLPLAGAPEDTLEDAPEVREVAVLGLDYVGMKPTMQVREGDHVRLGQLLFEDKRCEGVRFTAPASGTVTAVHRGEKRALVSVVIRIDESATDAVRFGTFTNRHPSSLSREEVRDLLLESGLWTALRGRPFSQVADPAALPHSIFVTAMDSHPHAPPAALAYRGRESDFARGTAALLRLTEGPVFVCRAPGTNIEPPKDPRVRIEEFSGPHPAGTVGVHIHHLDPVDRHKLVWHVDLQDVLAIGRLFEKGELDCTRVISLAGPAVARPRLLRTRLGASVAELVRGQLHQESAGQESTTPKPPARIISGSTLSGRRISGPEDGFLGRYHHQISAIYERTEREFLGWLAPGLDKFSFANLFLSKLVPGKKFPMGTSTNGSPRAIVPMGFYERVLPMDLVATYLLKSLVMNDVEKAEELGALELDEEDLALCTFVCPGKIEYGAHLRTTLTSLQKEG